MMFVVRLLTASAFGLFCACSALSDAKATMQSIFTLQAQLKTEFPGETMNVIVSTGGRLSVETLNSRIADLPEIEREVRTRQIAVFERDHCQQASTVQSITIVLKSEAGDGGFWRAYAFDTRCRHAVGDIS